MKNYKIYDINIDSTRCYGFSTVTFFRWFYDMVLNKDSQDYFVPSPEAKNISTTDFFEIELALEHNIAIEYYHRDILDSYAKKINSKDQFAYKARFIIPTDNEKASLALLKLIEFFDFDYINVVNKVKQTKDNLAQIKLNTWRKDNEVFYDNVKNNQFQRNYTHYINT